MAKAVTTKKTTRRRVSKNIESGKAHIHAGGGGVYGKVEVPNLV